MKRKSVNLAQTWNGYLQYLKSKRSNILFKYSLYDTKEISYEYELEEYIELRELVQLDNEFFSLLTFGEKIVVEETIKNTKLNDFGEEILKETYEKWIKVFFEEEPCKEIDKKKLGEIIKKIREINGYSKTELGLQIGFDRSYIARVESGKMMPSFVFIYRLSKICNMVIDKIVELLNC